MQITASRPRLTAVLGPTNTGKTYLAVERMLGHRSGMIGFPLRLLARENYDRIVGLRGARAVALVTGEEKIIPPNPSYFVCTVESMPLDRRVAFLAVDEIQMAADPERGHVFTDRLLHARGEEETMFLGADTARNLIRLLVPGIEFIARPRFSSLTYIGHKKVTRLPPRSAVVAFSASEVYRIAELIRRQRGGTAVVLGALSPRARNAQVGMYQAGEVEYLVATDAIGMGLNMDVRHVAFSNLRKFDGRQPRALLPAEVAQIAGRAGRHMSDGTFGTTADQEPMSPELVEALELHNFEPLKSLAWRNSDLDFGSIAGLLASLERPPPSRGLTRAREGDDHRALAALAEDKTIRDRARRRDEIALLWEVCQIPDFRKTLTDSHTRLLHDVFLRLLSPAGRLPADWVARQVKQLERVDVAVDALMARIAGTRTWTYLSHRAGWLDDAGYWQERTRAIEDKLSDALHDRLTQRFVDRRTAVLVRRLRDGGDLLGAVTRSGDVVVEGEFVGELRGFRFNPDKVERGADTRPLMNAAQRVLRTEIGYRVARLAGDDAAAFSLDEEGRILWEGGAVARIVPGPTVLSPRVEPIATDLLDREHKDRIRARVAEWLSSLIERELPDLAALRALVDANGGDYATALSGPGRGLIYHLQEWLGLVPRREVDSLVVKIGKAERRTLARAGVRIGSTSVFVASATRPNSASLRRLLWAVHNEHPIEDLPHTTRRRRSAEARPDLPESYYAALGISVAGGRAVPVDRLERLVHALRKLSREGAFEPPAGLRALVGCSPEQFTALLKALGYVESATGEGRFEWRGRRPERAAGKRRQKPSTGGRRRDLSTSPFAKLRELDLGR